MEEPAEAAAVAEVAVPEQAEELKEATEESAPEVTDITQEGIYPAASLALPPQSKACSRHRTCVCF